MQIPKAWVLWPLALGLVLAGLTWLRLHWIESSQDGPILAAAQRYGVHPALVKAVVWRESRFDPLARGRKREIGLMQIMPATGQAWATAEKRLVFDTHLLFDPDLNTRVGAWYLARVLKRYPHADDPLPYALADYNAGRANVLRWAKDSAATNSALFVQQITYPSTREYIKAVTNRFARYARTFPPRSSASSTTR